MKRRGFFGVLATAPIAAKQALEEGVEMIGGPEVPPMDVFDSSVVAEAPRRFAHPLAKPLYRKLSKVIQQKERRRYVTHFPAWLKAKKSWSGVYKQHVMDEIQDEISSLYRLQNKLEEGDLKTILSLAAQFNMTDEPDGKE